MNVELLIEQLTVEEKVSLLAGVDFWTTKRIERLGIPSIKVSDGPNGIRGSTFFDGVPANCFPCGTALSSTFNKDLLFEAGKLMGEDATLRGVHCVLGPTCNIARSPLGGRTFESFSEDPLLSGYAAAALINGIQSTKVLACIKHFVCNDQEGERKAVNACVTERALREIYLKPFQIALRESNPKALMTAYNIVNGEHVSQLKKFLQDILRKEWGYGGLTMSDWHGTYSTKKSLDAGLNLEMPGPTRFRLEVPTSHMVYSNEIHIDAIDENVRHFLNFVNRCIDSGIPEDSPEISNNSPEISSFLRRIASELIVLLKNENNILPLSFSNTRKIAVIGPNAKYPQESGGGSAALSPSYVVSPFEGISEKFVDNKNCILEYSLGATLNSALPDVALLLKDENSKPGISAKFYKLPPGSKDRQLFETRYLSTSRNCMTDYEHPVLGDSFLYYVDFEGYFIPEETGTYEIGCSTLGTSQIFVNNELIVDNETNQVSGDAFFLGKGTREERSEIEFIKGKRYDIKVKFGSAPTYTLSNELEEKGGVYFGFALKKSPEEEINKAVALAKSVDTVILCIGLSKQWESEGFDRPDMDIPGYTNKLIESISHVNSNVVIVNQSGSPISMPWVGKVPAILQCWYGGNELGNAIADVLFGDVNPSGKLSLTFPKAIQDNPSYLNFGSTNGRVLYGEDVFVGYRYYEKVGKEVLFPFGFGLSYTSFQFSALEVTVDDVNVRASIKITNVGEIGGAETCQLYVQPSLPSIIRPQKELKQFTKIFLEAGGSKIVELVVLIREATSFWDSYNDKWCSEKGEYQIHIGNSSDCISISRNFELEKSHFWLGL